MRLPRYSLGTLFIALSVVAVILGTVVRGWQWVQRERYLEEVSYEVEDGRIEIESLRGDLTDAEIERVDAKVRWSLVRGLQ